MGHLLVLLRDDIVFAFVAATLATLWRRHGSPRRAPWIMRWYYAGAVAKAPGLTDEERADRLAHINAAEPTPPYWIRFGGYFGFILPVLFAGSLLDAATRWWSALR